MSAHGGTSLPHSQRWPIVRYGLQVDLTGTPILLARLALGAGARAGGQHLELQDHTARVPLLVLPDKQSGGQRSCGLRVGGVFLCERFEVSDSRIPVARSARLDVSLLSVCHYEWLTRPSFVCRSFAMDRRECLLIVASCSAPMLEHPTCPDWSGAWPYDEATLHRLT